MPEEVVLAKGLIERIGMTGSSFSLVSKSAEEKVTRNIKDHREAVDMLLKQLLSLKVIRGYNEIDAIGHRDDHGGEYFDDSALLGVSVSEKIGDMSEFTPLQNHAKSVGI